MNKSTKLTSSLAVGALLLVNGAPFVNPVEAKDAPMVSVENKNINVSAQLIEQDGRNYLSVLALNDVNNVSVKVKVSNGQVITFKQASLKANETVLFELNIKDAEAIKAAKAKSSKKALPKTEVVRESLLVSGKLKGFDINAVISYDVEKVEPTAKVELPQGKKDDTTKSEVESKVDKDTKDSVVSTTPTEKKEPRVEENVKADLVENKDEVSLKEQGKQPSSEEKSTEENSAESKTIVANSATKEATSKEANRMDADIKVDTNNTQVPDLVNPITSGEARTAETTVKKVATLKTDQKATTALKSAPKETVAKFTPSADLQGNFDEAVAQEVFNQLNAHRAKHGLQPLTVSVELASGAEIRAKEFATKALSGKAGKVLHTRLDNSKWYTAFGGYANAKGENLSYSVNGASGLMGFWKSSPSHNAAMLNPKFTKVLVKVFKHGSTYYGVQIFG